MQVWIVGAVLVRVVVGPHKQESIRRDGVTRRNDELCGVGQVVGERVAGQIDRRRPGVVEFKPIVVVTVGRVGDGARVTGHPLVDGHGHGGPGIAVGAARRREIKLLAFGGRAVRKRAVGTIGVDEFVVEIIDDGRLAAGKSCCPR